MIAASEEVDKKPNCGAENGQGGVTRDQHGN
jgi:hypothetical protein